MQLQMPAAPGPAHTALPSPDKTSSLASSDTLLKADSYRCIETVTCRLCQTAEHERCIQTHQCCRLLRLWASFMTCIVLLAPRLVFCVELEWAQSLHSSVASIAKCVKFDTVLMRQQPQPKGTIGHARKTNVLLTHLIEPFS